MILAYSIAEGVSATALHASNHDPLIFPIAVAIAGIHFWVFARVLDTWQYYVAGTLDCLVVAMTLLMASPTSMAGETPSWIFYPLLGNGAALFVTAFLMLFESRSILTRLNASA
ncbi:MAG: hypothetical protein M3069_15530 [Chloroflexota bacterium]|nr:hypothetical protein [Chloroflexota bacterium]